jgi:SAM-dependent methyltransferase
MGFHTFDADGADRLEDAAARYRHCSREELHALVSPHSGMALADLGSGTGFYTDDLAPHVDRLYAVDVQTAMHDRYREKGVPAAVELVAADAVDLPFADGALDAVLSTMTFHEFADPDAVREVGASSGPAAASSPSTGTGTAPARPAHHGTRRTPSPTPCGCRPTPGSWSSGRSHAPRRSSVSPDGMPHRNGDMATVRIVRVNHNRIDPHTPGDDQFECPSCGRRRAEKGVCPECGRSLRNLALPQE